MTQTELLQNKYNMLTTMATLSQILGFIILIAIVVGSIIFFLRACLGIDVVSNKERQEKEKDKEKEEKEEIKEKNKEEEEKEEETSKNKKTEMETEPTSSTEEIKNENEDEDAYVDEDEDINKIITFDIKEQQEIFDEYDDSDIIFETGEDVDYGELEEYISGKTGTDDVPAFDESYVNGLSEIL